MSVALWLTRSVIQSLILDEIINLINLGNPPPTPAVPGLRFGATLHSRLPQIAAGLDEWAGQAAKAMANQVAEEAKMRVPVDTGALRDAIHVEEVGHNTFSVVAGDTQVYYGHFLEYGTTDTPARPFMIPAAEAVRVLGLG